MANDQTQHFVEGIFYEDRVPLGWRILQQLPGSSEQLHLAHQNCQILQALLSMDSMIHDADDEPDHIAHELVRLDNKLNLLLGMVGKLLGQVVQMPEPVAACIGGQGLQFGLTAEQAESVTAHPGQLVMLEIYLNPQLPGALNLCAELSLKRGPGGAPTGLASYRQMDPNVLELMEKYIFRQHRRAVALAKKSHSE